jgi:uncharacterized protein (TIGR03435 family)
MIAGAPSWMKAENYDIEAKVDGSDVAELGKFSREQRNLMLQALLEDRFKLKYHCETKELPAFALVIAKNGPKFSGSKPDDPCKAPHSMKIRGIYQLSAQGISMTELLNMLSQESGRSVVDKTGWQVNMTSPYSGVDRKTGKRIPLRPNRPDRRPSPPFKNRWG